MTDNARSRIAFVGDSLTAWGHWEDWFPDQDVQNLGVAGDTTDDVCARVEQVIETHPDEVVMMVGSNDLGARASVEHVVRNIENVMVELRRELPESRLLMVSIPPRGREFADRIRDANRHLRQFAATVHAQYLDLWPTLALEDGELNPAYSDDRLHLTDDGYAAWLDELRPGLARLRDEPPMSGVITLPRLSPPQS